MNDADDNLDKTIEDSLRQAHLLVQLRPEWAAQVLNQISKELEQNRCVDRRLETLQLVSPSLRRSRDKITTVATGLAVGLLLAVLGSAFLWRSMNLDRASEAAKSVAINPLNGLPTGMPPVDVAQSSNATTEPQFAMGETVNKESADAVSAGTGYLATKLSSDAQFEIYVVLPTRPINRNTN